MKPTPTVFCLILLAACGSQSPAAADAGQGADPAPSTAAGVDRLPLKPGYFVAADVACGDASNATVMLHDGKGINSSREACRFTRIEKTGPNTYATAETCTVIGGMGGGGPEPSEVEYTIESPEAFSADNRTYDWQYAARHCPQSALPEPWRSNQLDP
ncbi:hypothetical protein [Lysobacter sp. F6437]|uniref:hypothetical protein n=1 Tax=Lysobacter sp. F6437 TaxID=3459296 RepID=UPI00403D6200